MTKSYKADGIIVARKNFGETDKLVTIFTKQYGKKVVLAKGIRRITSRRAPHLELFSAVSLVLRSGKSFDYITEVTTQEFFPYIRDRLERVGYVYVALELTARFTAENQEAFRVYERLIMFLRRLNDSHITRIHAKKELAAFKFDVLAELGFIQNDVTLTEDRLDAEIERILEANLVSPTLLTKIERRL